MYWLPQITNTVKTRNSHQMHKRALNFSPISSLGPFLALINKPKE